MKQSLTLKGGGHCLHWRVCVIVYSREGRGCVIVYSREGRVCVIVYSREGRVCVIFYSREGITVERGEDVIVYTVHWRGCNCVD